MKAINISRRNNWKQHIQDNAYQADVLSNPKEKYWVEALEQPFAIQFDCQEETSIAVATEKLNEMCGLYLDWFFTDQSPSDVDFRLAKLKINKNYWQAIKNSWYKDRLSISTRFDLSVTETGDIKLLEINGETALLGAETVYQWNWFCDYTANTQKGKIELPSDSSQFNEYWDMTAGQLRRIAKEWNLKETGISFLVDENLDEDSEMAMQLVQVLQDEVDSSIYTQLVYLRGLKDDKGNEIQKGLGFDEEGYFIDHANDRITCMWKMYDWSDIQNDVESSGCTPEVSNQLELGNTKVLEPLWKQVLSNKGSLAFMWEQFKDTEYSKYLLETYFDTDMSTEATELLVGMHVRKPMLGLEGVATSIESGVGALETKESFGYGDEGFIIQEYTELPVANGYSYMVGSWVINDEAAGIIIRGDTSKITGRHCLIIPHIVSNNGLFIPGFD